MRTSASPSLPGSANSPGGVAQVTVRCKLLDSVGLGWGLACCVANRSPGGVVVAGWGHILKTCGLERTCRKEGMFRLWVLGCEAGLLDLILQAAKSYWWDGGAGHAWSDVCV